MYVLVQHYKRLKCKKKSYLLNYGKCQFHGEILPKSKHRPDE